MSYKINPFTGKLDDVGEGGGINFIYRQGSYQPFNYIFSGANSALTTNQLKGGFITVLGDCEIDRMAIYPVAGVAGNSVWGVYELDPVTMYPTNLLFQTGVINNGSATVQFTDFSPAQSLPAGIYLAAGITDSGATFQAHNGVSPMIHGAGVSAINFNDYFQGWRIAYAYTPTLPSTFPAGASIFSNDFVIKPAFRIA